MPTLPEDEPFGVATGLKPPSAAAAERAKPLFEKFLSGDTTAAGPLPRSQFGGGRRYDVALSIVAALPGMKALTAAEETVGHEDVTRVVQAPAAPSQDEATRVASAAELEEFSTAVTQVMAAPPPPAKLSDEATASLPARPPRGVPTVRRSAPKPPPSEPVAQEMLERTVDTALFWHEPDGGQTFQLAIRNDVFNDLSCTLTVVKGRVTATFRVLDDNQRRLLEAEAGQLRLALEQKGLRVDDIKVVLE